MYIGACPKYTKRDVVRKITNRGGRVPHQPTKYVTIAIIGDTLSNKNKNRYNEVRRFDKYGAIKFVTIKWLEDCIKKGECLDCTSYKYVEKSPHPSSSIQTRSTIQTRSKTRANRSKNSNSKKRPRNTDDDINDDDDYVEEPPKKKRKISMLYCI